MQGEYRGLRVGNVSFKKKSLSFSFSHFFQHIDYIVWFLFWWKWQLGSFSDPVSSWLSFFLELCWNLSHIGGGELNGGNRIYPVLGNNGKIHPAAITQLRSAHLARNKQRVFTLSPSELLRVIGVLPEPNPSSCCGFRENTEVHLTKRYPPKYSFGHLWNRARIPAFISNNQLPNWHLGAGKGPFHSFP